MAETKRIESDGKRARERAIDENAVASVEMFSGLR